MAGTVPHLDILHDDGGWRVGLWHNILMTSLSRPPSASSLEHVRRAQSRLLSHQGPVGGLTLAVGVRLGPFDVSERMRSQIGEMMNVPNLRGHSAIVIESEGFAGATVRAVLGAVILLARPESPQKIFETRADAAKYLSRHAPGPWSPEELLEASTAMTAGLGG